MQKNFTNRFTQLLAAAINWRKPITTIALLGVILTTTFYLWAAIGVPNIVSLFVSSDKASNGPLPGFTPLSNIVIREASSNDFKNNASGNLTLTAPAGWVFKASGVNLSIINGGGGQPDQINVTGNGSITYPAPNANVSLPNSATIVIPYRVNGENRFDQLTISGLEVIPVDGNILTPGNVQLTATGNVAGASSPITVATLTQTIGSPRKLTFATQPGATNTSVVGENLINQPQVRFLDFFNRELTTGTNPVTLSISSGTTGAVLTGGTTNAVNGLATFAGVKIDLAGDNYKLTATSSLAGGTTTVESATFTVNNKLPTITSLSTNPACVTAGTTQNFTATIIGTNFAPSATVRLTYLNNNTYPPVDFSGANVTVNSSTQLTVNVGGTFVQIAPAGNYSVQVINLAPVQSGTVDTEPFTIYPQLNAGTINGDNNVCAGATGVEYSIPVVIGADSYNWSVPSGATITNTVTNEITSQITVNFGTATPGTSAISVAAVNECGTAGPASSFPVTINPLPVTSISAIGSTQSCTAVRLEAIEVVNANYQWLLNGVIIPGAPNQRIYDAPTSGRYSVQVTNNNNTCPYESNFIDVIILTPTNIITNGPTANFCVGGNVTLIALKDDNNAYSYRWFNGNTEINGDTDNELVVSTEGNYSVELTIPGAPNTPPNCVITSTATSVRELLAINTNTISTPFSTQCANTPPTQIDGSSPGGGAGPNTYSYRWLSSTNGINYTTIEGATEKDYTPKVALTQSTYFQRIVFSSSCTDVSPAVRIMVNPVIAGNSITTPSQYFCTGSNPILLEASAPSGGAGPNTYSYRWLSSTDGINYAYITPPATDPNYTYDPGAFTGTIRFRREVASGGCISTSEPVAITVASPPVANAGTDQEVCSNVGVQIGTAPVGNNLLYAWSPADGSLSSTTEAQPTVTITNNTTTAFDRTYTLKVTNPVSGCFTTDEVKITVNPQPQVSFNLSTTSLCLNSSPITLTGGSPAGGTYSGSGVSNGQFNPASAGEGQHLIRYSYTDPTTTCPNIATQIIMVNPLPVADAGLGKTICSGGSTTIGTTPLAGLTYSWSPATGLSDATAAQPTVTLANTGTTAISQTYTLTVTNTTTTPNCVSTNSSQVTITVNPLPTVSVNSPTTCAGTPVTITATAANGTSPYNYNWTVPAGVTKPATTASSFQTTVAGTYSVVVTDAQSCVSASGSGTVTVNPLPVANAGSAKTILCPGGSTTIGTAAVAGLTYSWSPVTGLSNPNIAQPTVTLGNSGTTASTQTYTLTVTNTATTCQSVPSSVVVTVNPLPQLDFATRSTTYYTGEGNVPLIATVNGVVTSGGTFSVRNLNSATVIPNAIVNGNQFAPCTAGAGTKIISYTYTNNNNCTATIEKEVTVTQSIYQAVVTSNLKPFCRGDNVTHTVKLYREAEVIYPYLTNAAGQPIRKDGSLVGPQELPVSNPDYEFPVGTPEAVKLLAYRFFNPIGKGGTEILGGQSYQWTKNQQENIGPNDQQFSNAGLSSLDYYAAYVTANSICADTSTILSSRTYTGQITGYAITLEANKNPICPGDEVTFTAKLDETFPIAWSLINLQLNWIKVTAAGVRTVLHTTSYTGTEAERAAALQYKTTTLQNGDRISIEFTSDLNGAYAGSKCFGEVLPTNVITMVVAINQTLTNVDYCAGSTGSIRLNDSQTGISYQLLLNGAPVGNVVAGTGNRIDFNGLTAGSYSVQSIVSGSPCLTYGPITLTQNPLPAAPTASSQEVCSDGTSTQRLTASATVPDGFSVIWYTSLNGTGTTTRPIREGVGTSRYYAALQNTNTTCIGPRTEVILTILPRPVAPISGGNQTVCSDGSTTQTLVATATVPNGFSVIWYINPNGITPSDITTSPILTEVGSITYYAAAQNQNTSCIGPRTPVTLTINPRPVTQTVTAPSYCASTSPNGTVISLTNTQAGVTYRLMDATTNPNSVLATLVGTGNGVQSFTGTYKAGTYSVSATTAAPASCSVIISSNVTVIETASVLNAVAEIVSSPNPLVYFQPATFTATPEVTSRPNGTPIAWRYQWTIRYATFNQPLPISNSAVLNLTSEQMNVDFREVIVIQLAPENDITCYSSLASLAIESDNLAPLPVELLYLKADKKENGTVVVEWSTAMEKNSEGFEVQVSQDAKNYRSLGFVASQNGNSNQQQKYTFHDKENGKYGTRYYRLKQVDLDGTSEFFGPKAVKMGDLVESISAYPNPFSSEITLEINAEEAGTAHVTIHNAVGSKVLERTLQVQKGMNKQELQLNAGLPLGVYTITTRINGRVSHFKLLKQ